MPSSFVRDHDETRILYNKYKRPRDKYICYNAHDDPFNFLEKFFTHIFIIEDGQHNYCIVGVSFIYRRMERRGDIICAFFCQR